MTSSEQRSKPGRLRKVILKGGPGQGKSTVTQMLAQRQRVLLRRGEPRSMNASGNLNELEFRLESIYVCSCEWLQRRPGGTIEQFVARVLSRYFGGSQISC